MNPSGPFLFDEIDDEVWEEVYAEQAFAFVWPRLEEWVEVEQEPPPPPPDPPENGEPESPPPPGTTPIVVWELIYHDVIAVFADDWPDVAYNLAGVSGAYRWCALFDQIDIRFATHDRGGGSCDYLYHYAPDPRPYRLIPYDCLYRNGERRTWIIRVWQDYNIGRDWIIQRVAAEVARDVAQDDPLQWPINDRNLPGHPCLPSAD